MIAERTEYKGRPTLTLKRDEADNYPFSFGLGKAKLLLEGIEEVRKFVKDMEAGANAKNSEPSKSVLSAMLFMPITTALLSLPGLISKPRSRNNLPMSWALLAMGFSRACSHHDR